MVAKISVGSSLYGAIAYNGEKINEAQGRLLTTNRIYNDGSGTVDIGKCDGGFSHLPATADEDREAGGAYLSQPAPGGCADRY